MRHYKPKKRGTRKRNPTKRIFTKKDYRSNDGFATSIWGPTWWHCLHTMSFNYPVQPSSDDKIHYRDYMNSLVYVLPCGKCRQNLTKNFEKYPLTMDHLESRDTFSKYVYNLHELVNRMLKKKSGLTYCDVRERYEHFRARCSATLKPDEPKEKGCSEPLYGRKSKCVLHIIPQDKDCETFTVDKTCMKKHEHTEM